MYDENELYEECKKTVTTVGQDIYKLIGEISKFSNTAEPQFTGQSTDLNYFSQNNTMPISTI